MSSYFELSRFYDELTEKNISYNKRADYFDKIIRKFMTDAKTLLDIGCGTGKMCEQLALKGYSVIGSDISVDMLTIAQQNSSSDVFYICQDMRNIKLASRVDVIISTLDSINHLLTQDDVKACFKSVYENLNENGLFVFDMNTIYKHSVVMGNNSFVYDTDNVYLVWNSFYDEDTYTNEIVIDIFEKQGNAYYRSGESFFERAYPMEWVKETLGDIGFTVLGVYNADTENEASPNEERYVYVVRK